MSGETALRLALLCLKDPMTRKTLTPFLMCAALLLSGCGIKGNLETPPPIWGEKSGTTKPVDPDTDS